MVIRSVLPSLGSSQRQILYFGQRRDYKGDEVSPSVVLRLSNCLQSWNVTLLSQSISIWRASAPYSYTVCYCINCTVCTVFIYCIQYCTLTWYELRFINDLARKRTVYTVHTVYTVYTVQYIDMIDVLFTKLRWCAPISEHLHLARKRTVYIQYIQYILYILYTVYILYCIYCIYCTVNEYRDDAGEKTVLGEWRTVYIVLYMWSPGAPPVMKAGCLSTHAKSVLFL